MTRQVPFSTFWKGGHQEAVLVHLGIAGQVGDQADVGAFRRLDGAQAAIVAVVDVTDVEVGPLPGKAAGAQGGHAPLVGQLRQGVGLVHELAQGAGAEELLDGRGDGPDVDQALGGDNVQVLEGHPLPDHALHPGKADTELVLQQLAHTADAAVAQMIDVIRFADVVGQAVEVVHRGKHIVHDDVLGDQKVNVLPDGFFEFLAGVLVQELPEDDEPDPLLDTHLGGIKVHKVFQIHHTVGKYPDGMLLPLDPGVDDAFLIQFPGTRPG